jgi:hypothetical protein
MIDDISKVFDLLIKVGSYLSRRRKERQPLITFAHISTPNIPEGGQIQDTSPSNNPFNITMTRFFKFGNVDPVFDVTIINQSEKPILLTSVGIEIVQVAQEWFVAGVIEPQVIKVSERIVIIMPDIWEVLEKRGCYTKLARFHGTVPFAELLPVENIKPQPIGKLIFRNLPDPVYLNSSTPYRYTLLLDKYRSNMPDDAVLKLIVRTNYGEVKSDPFYIFVLGHIQHVVGEKEAKTDKIIEQANMYFTQGNFQEAEPLLRKALDALKKSHDETDL